MCSEREGMEGFNDLSVQKNISYSYLIKADLYFFRNYLDQIV